MMTIEESLKELRDKLQQHDEALNFLTMISQAGRDAKYLGDCIVLLCDVLDEMNKEKKKDDKKKARARKKKLNARAKKGKMRRELRDGKGKSES